MGVVDAYLIINYGDMHLMLANTGKMPCKYGPIFAPYLHDWTLYGVNTVQNGSVFTWRFSCASIHK